VILLLVQLTISDLVAGATDDLFFGLAASAAGGPVILLLVQLTDFSGFTQLGAWGVEHTGHDVPGTVMTSL
jgi:hypothetical protein